MSQYLAAIKAGLHNITAVGAERQKDGSFKLEGFAHAVSSGFRAGRVDDIAKASESIAFVMGRLRKKTGKKIQDMFSIVSSLSIKNIPCSGGVLLSKYGREVEARDVNKCVKIASTIKMPLHREVLHKIITGFSIDENEKIKNPLNLEGVRMGLNMNILTIDSAVLDNMSKAIAQAGFIPKGFVFSAIACSYRVLTEKDKEAGAVLLNIHEDITEVVIYAQGIFKNCRIVPIGADDIFIKDGGINREGLERFTSQIILTSDWKEVKNIIVIGEGVATDDFIEVLEQYFSIPIKIGSCIPQPSEKLPIERTGYIENLGIFDHLRVGQEYSERDIIKRLIKFFSTFVDTYF